MLYIVEKEVEIMKNQFTITPDIVREYQHLYWKKAFRPLRILICIVALLVAAGFFYRLLTENIISIPLLLCFLLVLGLFFILRLREKKEAALDWERRQVLSRGKPNVSTVELLDDGIHTHSVSGENFLTYNQVKSWTETNNLLVIFVDGRMILPLYKQGFLQGDTESCKALLKEKTGK